MRSSLGRVAARSAGLAASYWVLAALVVGLGLGIARASFGPGKDVAAISAAARKVGESVAADDVEAVWMQLDPETRHGFEKSHAALLALCRSLAETREAAGQFEKMQLEALEREYAMRLPKLLETRPATLWAIRTRAAIAARGGSRAAFANLDLEGVETDGLRARVRCRLRDGRPQGLHLVQRDGAWKLVDFRPYTEVERCRPARAPKSE